MLSVQSVSLFYGAAQALDDVSLEVPTAAITAVIGRNGVGKTSLLRAIVGLSAARQGSVSLDGKPLDRAAPFDRARAGIAYVPQGREIFPLLTVKENLETGYACNKPADRSVPDYIFELFPVLADMMRRRGGDLSGGQQQQLAIGRALVTRPKVLILDEPTEGIQPSIIQDIGRAIRYLRHTAGIAVLLVEQYLDFVQELADGVHVMDRGQIVFSGGAADLDKDSVRRHLVV
ncbi:MAG: urea ABC transporter ATP-binding subunit UrtE [Pseudomonadota bacterium]